MHGREPRSVITALIGLTSFGRSAARRRRTYHTDSAAVTGPYGSSAILTIMKMRVEFVTAPRTEPYGQIAVFLDISGNRWDLLGPA